MYGKDCQFARDTMLNKLRERKVTQSRLQPQMLQMKIKEAAEAKNESLYYEIKDIDLIAK